MFSIATPFCACQMETTVIHSGVGVVVGGSGGCDGGGGGGKGDLGGGRCCVVECGGVVGVGGAGVGGVVLALFRVPNCSCLCMCMMCWRCFFCANLYCFSS